MCVDYFRLDFLLVLLRVCCLFQTDFLLVLLREIVNAFPSLRVILMSATVDTTLFTHYFGNCKVVEVYGRTFPVQGKLAVILKKSKLSFIELVCSSSIVYVNVKCD